MTSSLVYMNVRCPHVFIYMCSLFHWRALTFLSQFLSLEHLFDAIITGCYCIIIELLHRMAPSYLLVSTTAYNHAQLGIIIKVWVYFLIPSRLS